MKFLSFFLEFNLLETRRPHQSSGWCPKGFHIYLNDKFLNIICIILGINIVNCNHKHTKPEDTRRDYTITYIIVGSVIGGVPVFLIIGSSRSTIQWLYPWLSVGGGVCPFNLGLPQLLLNSNRSTFHTHMKAIQAAFRGNFPRNFQNWFPFTNLSYIFTWRSIGLRKW